MYGDIINTFLAYGMLFKKLRNTLWIKVPVFVGQEIIYYVHIEIYKDREMKFCI